MNHIISMQMHNQLHPHPIRKTADKLRKFSPIILFDERTDKNSDDEDCVHTSQNDEYKDNLINTKYKKVQEMLNERCREFSIYFQQREYEHQDYRQPIQLSARIYSHSQDQSIDLTKPKRRRGNLPKAVTALLKDWLSRHRKHPYPTEEEKSSLAKETKLTLQQISNWFINARRRHLPHLLENDFSGNSRSQRSPELDIYYEADSTDSDNGRLSMRTHAKCSRISKAGGGVKKPYNRRKASP